VQCAQYAQCVMVAVVTSEVVSGGRRLWHFDRDNRSGLGFCAGCFLAPVRLRVLCQRKGGR